MMISSHTQSIQYNAHNDKQRSEWIINDFEAYFLCFRPAAGSIYFHWN